MSETPSHPGAPVPPAPASPSAPGAPLPSAPEGSGAQAPRSPGALPGASALEGAPRPREARAVAPEYESLSEEAERWKARAEQAERESALRQAIAGIPWFDPGDAYRELAAHTKRHAGGGWVVEFPGSSGAPGEAPARLSPAEAARALAKRKPHWVRARVAGGTGAGSGFGAGAEGAASAPLSYAELLRPKNSALLRDYLHNRKEDLERLRQAHFRR